MRHEDWYYFIRIVEMIKAKPSVNITSTLFSDATETPVEKMYVVVNKMVEQNLIQYGKDDETLEITQNGWESFEFQKGNFEHFKQMVNDG